MYHICILTIDSTDNKLIMFVLDYDSLYCDASFYCGSLELNPQYLPGMPLLAYKSTHKAE